MASDYAGLDLETVRSWLRRSKQREAGELVDFRRNVRKARAAPAVRASASLVAKSRDNFRAAEQFLKLRERARARRAKSRASKPRKAAAPPEKKRQELVVRPPEDIAFYVDFLDQMGAFDFHYVHHTQSLIEVLVKRGQISVPEDLDLEAALCSALETIVPKRLLGSDSNDSPANPPPPAPSPTGPSCEPVAGDETPCSECVQSLP